MRAVVLALTSIVVLAVACDDDATGAPATAPTNTPLSTATTPGSVAQRASDATPTITPAALAPAEVEPTHAASPTPAATPTPVPTPFLAASRDDECYDFYYDLFHSSGDAFINVVLSAESGCIHNLQWVGDSWLQAKVSDEESVVAVAEAIRTIAEQSGRGRLDDIHQLAIYLVQFEDIHNYCLEGRTCEGPAWHYAKSYPTGPGTHVYEAGLAAVDAFLDVPNGQSTKLNTQAHNLIELAAVVNSLGLQSAYIPLMAEWINQWNESHSASESSQNVMWWMLDMIYWGHRKTHFGRAFGEDRELMKAFGDFMLDERWLGTESQWIMARFALEMGRYTKYKDTTNYDEAVPIIKSVIETYEGKPEAKSIWLRVLSEIDYNDSHNCERYDLCGWYEGDGFQTNFRKVLFPDVIECPKTACEGNSIGIFAEDLEQDSLELACERLYDIGVAFQEFCGTECKPVEADVNSRLEIFIFNDWASCDALEAGGWGGWPDACSGIYWEGDPLDQDTPAQFVATEFTPDENPRDPDLAIWNFEHEYVHYLDGRYNRSGAYSPDPTRAWWIEGFAEYFAAESSPYIDPPYRNSPYTMLETFLESGSIPTRYPHRHLAVRFLLENHRDFIDQLLALMRQGDYDEYVTVMAEAAPKYESEWQAWLKAGP